MRFLKIKENPRKIYLFGYDNLGDEKQEYKCFFFQVPYPTRFWIFNWQGKRRIRWNIKYARLYIFKYPEIKFRFQKNTLPNLQ